MTPMPPGRISAEVVFGPHASDLLTRNTPRNGYTGRFLVGRFADNLTWVCTEDLDGHIEVSFSYMSKRPSNAEIMSAWHAFGDIVPWREESKATGKVRHYIVQRGVLQ